MSNINVNNITPLAGTTGTVSISGSLFVTGSITAEGHIILGDSDTDSISFGAEVSSSVIPNADDTYNLGSSTKEWKDIYIDGTAHIDQLGNVDSDIINSSASLRPTADNTYDLGFPGLEWRNLYIDGVANIDTLGNVEATSVNVSASLIPTNNIENDLGSTTKLWDNTYASASNIFQLNPINVRNLGFAYTNLADRRFVQMSGSFIPYADDKFDLGHSTYEWRDLYVDGTAYIDTLSGVSSITTTTINVTSASISYLSGSSNIIVAATMEPSVKYTWDLGTATKPFNNIYASSSFIGYIKPPARGMGASLAKFDYKNYVEASASLFPASDDHFDLGTGTKQWRNLYVDGTAHMHQLGAYGETSVNASASIVPTNNYAVNLGSSTKLWNNTYASASYVKELKSIPGSLSIGSYTPFIKSSGSLIPSTDDKFDLGFTNFEWRDLYVDGTAYIDTLDGGTITATSASISYLSGSSNIIVAATMEPSVTETWDLGTTSKLWKNSYISHSFVGGLASAQPSYNYWTQGPYIEVSASLIPPVGGDDKFDLGSHGREWRTLYIDGVANIDTLGNSIANIVNISASLIPTNDNENDLGSTSKEWKDFYIDGTAYIDTVQAGGLTGDAGTVNILGQATASLLISGALSEVTFKNLPTTKPTATGSLWVSGSNKEGGSGYLMVFTGKPAL